MKIANLFIVLMLIPVAAFAGKPERDFMTNDGQPSVSQAMATLKSACGAEVKFNIKSETFTNLNELWLIKRFADSIKEGAETYCTDEGSKAAMRNLKAIEFSKGSDVTFNFKDGTGIATADSSSYPSWDMVTRSVDK